MQLFNEQKQRIGLIRYVIPDSFYIETTLDDKLLVFSMPFIEFNELEIKNEMYIRTKTDEFVIKEIDVQKDVVNIKCMHNLEELEGEALDNFNTLEQTVDATINTALAGTGYTCVLKDTSITKKRTVKMTNNSTFEILKAIKKKFMVEIEFDTVNKVVNVYTKRGADKGAYFIEKLNLDDINIQSNSHDFYTKMIAKGKNDLKVTVTNNTYSDKVKTIIWKDERYTVESDLHDDATLKLAELAKPLISYKASIIDLSNESGYSILSYSIGDIVTLVSKRKRTKITQRIIKITEYPLMPEKNTCEIANRILKFEDVQREQQDVAQTVDNITMDNGTISDAAVKQALHDLVVNEVDANTIQAVYARIGNLEATTAKITDLTAIHASITDLTAKVAKIGELDAATAKITVLEADTAQIKTQISHFFTGENAQTVHLTAGNVVIDNGVIKSAMIDSLAADKITTGSINTTNVTIASHSGNFKIADNTLQIKDDNNVVRIQVGKDASNDYSLSLFDSKNNLLWDARGITADAINRPIIRNDMVADNAAINGAKLDIASVFSVINADGSHTLNGNKIHLDNENQTLDVAFNSLNTKVNNIKVGSRNYFKKSTNVFPTIAANGSVTKDITNAPNGFVLSTNNNACTIRIADVINSNGYFTFSCYIKGEKSVVINSEITDVSGTPENIYVTTDWKYFTTTRDVTNHSNDVYNFVDLECPPNTGKVYLKDVKIEKGNIATDWTPAPEDVEEITTNLQTELTVSQGKINQLIQDTTIVKTDGTTTKLKDEYNHTVATVNTLTSEIATHTSELSALTGKITSVETSSNEIKRDLESTKSTVSASSTKITDVENKVDNLKVGGTNILKNSFINTTSTTYGFEFRDIKLEPNTEYAFSINGRVNGNIAGKKAVVFLYENSWNILSKSLGIDSSKDTTVSLTFKTPADFPPDTEIHTACYYYPSGSENDGGSATINWIKIEKGNIATDWTPAPDDITEEIKAAHDAANAAKAAADAAKTAADSANSLLADLSSDNKLTPIEKQTTKKEVDIIKTEKPQIDTDADKYSISKSDYDTAYTTLIAYVDPLLSDLTTTSDIVGNDFRNAFRTYYYYKQELLNAISAKAKSLADDADGKAVAAQASANAAKTAADAAHAAAIAADAKAVAAKTAADAAQTSATTANSLLADLSSDNKLTPIEKQETKKEVDIIKTEKPQIDANADKYSIDKSSYDTTYTTLIAYVDPLLSSLTTTSDIVGNDFRNAFRTYYYYKQELLNAIASKAKTLADDADAKAVAADNKINNLKIGGTNLIRGTKDFIISNKCFGDWTSGRSSFSDDDGFKVATITSSGSTSDNWASIVSNSYPANVGDEFIASFYFKCENLSALNGKGISSINFYNASGNRIENYDFLVPANITENNKWYKLSYSFKCTHSDILSSSMQVHLQRDGKISFKKLKLESGNHATDWTPSPDDLDEEIKVIHTTTSTIEQKLNSITSTVTETTTHINTLTTRVSTAESSISQLSTSITSKVSHDDVISIIKQTPTAVEYSFNNIAPTVQISSAGLNINNKSGQQVFGVDSSGNMIMNMYGSHFILSATGSRKNEIWSDVNDKLNIKVNDSNAGSGISIYTTSGKTILTWMPLDAVTKDNGFIWLGVETRAGYIRVDELLVRNKFVNESHTYANEINFDDINSKLDEQTTFDTVTDVIENEEFYHKAEYDTFEGFDIPHALHTLILRDIEQHKELKKLRSLINDLTLQINNLRGI